MNRLAGFLVLVICILLPSLVAAIDLGESVQIHGFVSQGYLHSSENNFLANSRSGSAESTDLGLNINWSILDSLRAGGQIFYRNLGDYSEDKVVLDWALIDYQPLDWLGVRLGKVKMPLGLYNENRDNDFLRPMIFLPQSIYDESRRDINLAYIGAGVYGNFPTGNWGDIDYHLFGGDSSYPDDSILNATNEKSLLSNISKNNAKPPPARNPLIPATLISQERKSKKLYGGAVVFNSTDSDLRLGLSLLHAKNDVYVNGVPYVKATTRSKFVVSLEYAWRDWLFATEYGETDRRSVSAGTVTIDGPSQAWYLMASYSPFEKWTFTALYDEFYRLKHDKDGETRPQSEPYMGWRKDFAVAVRYDFNDSWNVKAEYHTIDGWAMQLGTLNPNGVERFWNYFAAKLSYSF
jgi:hypothetical protein